MKRTKKAAALILILTGLGAGQLIPLPGAPDWTSIDNDYSTGGAFADINSDGYLDFCISNGNDMAANTNALYFNHYGALETFASWRSTDSGFFGHCSAGDVNNDGYPDLAVAYLGDYLGSSELRVRIYLNIGGTLETLPSWKAADTASSFDCCLGDFDLDGDLDLAISAGDAYRNRPDRVRIYRNNRGVFDSLPCWYGKFDTASDAIRFADIDNDGDLDLFVGHRRKVVMYRNRGGTFDTIPEWAVHQGIGWVLRIELGDYDLDGYLDLALAANDQISGDPNSIRVFHNTAGTLDTVPAFVMQRRGTRLYSSCVAWGDVNGDGYPELAAGGWWRPVVVYPNRTGVLDTLPGWSWSPANPSDLVCEALIWTDVGNRYLVNRTDTFNGDGNRRLFNLTRRPVQFLDSVLVNGFPVPVTDYCFDPGLGWISFATPPPPGTRNVICYYRYSTHPDLAVTNWDPTAGNFLFFNTTAVGLESELKDNRPGHRLTPDGQATAGYTITVAPNPGRCPVEITAPLKKRTPVRIYAQDGTLVRTLRLRPLSASTRKGAIPCGATLWDGRNENGTALPAGIYFITLSDLPPTKFLRVTGN